jgi:hypothetical protein
LRRHRLLVVVGVNLSLALALFSYVSISSSGFKYRGTEVWSNESTLALSEGDNRELRGRLGPSAQPDRFPSLVDLYAARVTSDAVVRRLENRGLLRAADVADGKLPIAGTAVPSAVNGGPTPLLKLTASGKTPLEATRLTVGLTQEFIAAVKADQIAAKIPKRDRLQLQIVTRATEPTLIQPRSKSKSILILLAGLTATFAAAFMRDNSQRGRPQQQGGQVTELPVQDSQRRPPDVFAVSESEPKGKPVVRSPDSEVDKHDGDSEAISR